MVGFYRLGIQQKVFPRFDTWFSYLLDIRGLQKYERNLNMYHKFKISQWLFELPAKQDSQIGQIG